MPFQGIGKQAKRPLRILKALTPSLTKTKSLKRSKTSSLPSDRVVSDAESKEPSLAIGTVNTKITEEIHEEKQNTPALVVEAIGSADKKEALDTTSATIKNEAIDVTKPVVDEHTSDNGLSFTSTMVEEHAGTSVEKTKEEPSFNPDSETREESRMTEASVTGSDKGPSDACVNIAPASSLVAVDPSTTENTEKMGPPTAGEKESLDLPQSLDSPLAGDEKDQLASASHIEDPDIDPFINIVDGSNSPIVQSADSLPDPLSKDSLHDSDKLDIALPPLGSEPVSASPMHPEARTSTHLAGVSDELPSVLEISNKSVPPTPPPASDSPPDDEPPELYTPALIIPTLFLPIPNTDPLTTLLIKHVPEPHLRPPRDVSGDWQHSDFHTLVMTNNWRALARMARDRIVSANPSETELILNLWYVRLSSLSRLWLFNQASAECESLFGALANIDPPATRNYVLNNLLPFELEVIRTRCAYWAGDHIGYLDDLSALLNRCKIKSRKAREISESSMWKERGARMSLIIASHLVEMKDYTAATSLLEQLGSQNSSPVIRSAIARIYLQGGYMSMAAHHFSCVDNDQNADATLKNMNTLILAAANGDWQTAEKHANVLKGKDADNILAINNCAVALVNQGRLKDAIQVLEDAIRASPSAITTVEPYLFNLSTLYELRSALTINRKRDLLIEVAKWSGDGVRTACLKMG